MFASITLCCFAKDGVLCPDYTLDSKINGKISSKIPKKLGEMLSNPYRFHRVSYCIRVSCLLFFSFFSEILLYQSSFDLMKEIKKLISSKCFFHLERVAFLVFVGVFVSAHPSL